MADNLFEDAVDTLRWCADHLADEGLELEEREARVRVVELCKDIAYDWESHVKQDVE